MVRDTTDRHPKLKRGDSRTDNSLKLHNQEANLYQKVFQHEEKEALSRSGDKDLHLFKETCDKFRDYVNKIYDLKINNPTTNKDTISQHRIDSSMLFLKLKKMNRLEKFRLNNAREKLYDTKRQVDNFHLQWQNLSYETHHLKKEISNCLSFKSKDEHVELIPVEEFYTTAPESVSQPHLTKTDPHQLRKARLDWELNQRKTLAETCRQEEEEKDRIMNEIRRKKDRIENLVPMIRNILSVTKPVQEHLGLPMSQLQNDVELVQMLPPSLYFLSIQTNAMREACDSLLHLSIVGDKDVATRFSSAVIESVTLEDSDSDEESKNHHHRRKTKSQIREEKIKKLLTKHPLSVNIQVRLKDGNSLSIAFYDLTNLHIVSVVPAANTNLYEGLGCRYILESRNILNGLYDNDYGDSSPNVANNYQLEQLGIEYNPLEMGIPYSWVQKLCGLNFIERTIGMSETVDTLTNADQRNMLTTIQRIREHFKSMIELCEQLEDIEKLMMPIQHREKIATVKMACTLLKWALLTWEQFNLHPMAKDLIVKFNLTEHDYYFEGVFVRNTAKLFLTVVVKSNYPNSTPVFTLRIENAGKKYTAQNSNDVRDMEKEVNFYVNELLEPLDKLESWVLTAQLNRLAICFDIFLECTDRENFPREKLFYHYARGRARSLPFKYVTRGSEGFFTQR